VLATAALFSPLRASGCRPWSIGGSTGPITTLNGWLRSFSVPLRDEIDLDVLGADLLGVVNQVLAPAHLTLWLRDTVNASTAPGAERAGPSAESERGLFR
jgi:hypothetical protein